MSTALRCGFCLLLVLCSLALGLRPGCAAASVADSFDRTTQSSKTLAEVRVQVVAAYGIPPPDVVSYEGTITDSNGSRIDYRESVLGDDFAVRQHAGGVQRAFGRYHSQYWKQNENGITRLLTQPADLSLL